jgi:hypothetical protein
MDDDMTDSDSKCDICGCPGEFRHSPGGIAPSSGYWCEACYRRLDRKTRMLNYIVIAVVMFLVSLVVVL